MHRPIRVSRNAAPTADARQGGAVLTDLSARGDTMRGLVQLAARAPRLSFEPAADSRAQRPFQGLGPVVQAARLTPIKGKKLTPGELELQELVKKYNKVPDVELRDTKVFQAHRTFIKAIRDKIEEFGLTGEHIETLKGELVEIESELEETLWGTVRPKSHKPGKPTKVKSNAKLDAGSASDVKSFRHFKKNPSWEVVFRLLSNVSPKAFDVARENDEVLDASRASISVPTSTSNDVIAVGRNPHFALGPLLSDAGWRNKICYMALLPAHYGVDLEAEYREFLAWRREIGEPLEDQEAVVEDQKKAAREIDILRMPATLVMGWAYRTEVGIVFQPHKGFKDPGVEVDRKREAEFRELIEAKNEELAKLQDLDEAEPREARVELDKEKDSKEKDSKEKETKEEVVVD